MVKNETNSRWSSIICKMDVYSLRQTNYLNNEAYLDETGTEIGNIPTYVPDSIKA